MTQADFVWLCEEHTINPSIALEDDGVRNILKQIKGGVAQQLALNTYLKNNF
jgi:hypothetical protein